MKTLLLTSKEVNGEKKAQTLPTPKKEETTAPGQKAAIQQTIEQFKPLEELKAEEQNKTIEKFRPKTPATAEERIQRILHFDAVSKRFIHLKEKSNDLKMFDAGNDKINAKIILQNQAGFKFEVSNSNVIKKVRDAMENELNILLNEAENEVLNFEI
jgi:hypothetical protein